MNAIERAIATVAPSWAARRARARLAVAQYDAVKLGHRAGSLRASRGDADASSGARTKLAFFARDMVRNTPFATSAQAVIAGAVTGDGIIPKVLVDKRINDTVAGRIKKRGLMWIERHFDTTAIDRRGQLNLYGLQRLVINTVVDAGECLVRLHRDSLVEGCLPFQVEVLEPDYLDATRWGTTADGSEIRQGVEYDAEGQRVAYWIFPQHPGSDSVMHPASGVSMRVPAAEMLHIYRLDRPGQSRGVSWFAPVMLRLQDLADHEDAQLLRQKIAACFAAFRTGGSGEAKTPDTIMPGAIYDLGDSEQISFAAPQGLRLMTNSPGRSCGLWLPVWALPTRT
ncbi:phage portal protein [Roseicitreum antarcticum]|uniref:phage portal protein n=1 Tax=Roseicitreum antarcticum TaxID=564137 RepID=UPI00168042F3|nr:phage portal protein [Roseicitreum antarcticum]